LGSKSRLLGADILKKNNITKVKIKWRIANSLACFSWEKCKNPVPMDLEIRMTRLLLSIAPAQNYKSF